MLTELNINKLSLMVNLGATQAERDTKQTVLLDAHILFQSPPKACESDDLNHTFCYQQLVDHINNDIKHRSFALVEHLVFSLHALVKPRLPTDSKLRICVTKFPAIQDLQDGVTFCYADPL